MDSQADSFKLGISMSGAATGGTFSAGVMDFFIEAMNEWDKARKAGEPDVPAWKVEVTNLCGTSAGGITSALTASCFNVDFKPYKGKRVAKGDVNPLYQTWVKEMDQSKLFLTTDLEGDDARLKSLLCADFIPVTARKVFSESGDLGALPDWGNRVSVSLTATSLRGVPYKAPEFIRAEGNNEYSRMRRYADHTNFAPSEDIPCLSNEVKARAIPLDMTTRTGADWDHVITCTAATAAFPIGFPSVKVDTPVSQYATRFPQSPD